MKLTGIIFISGNMWPEITVVWKSDSSAHRDLKKLTDVGNTEFYKDKKISV